MTLIVPPGGFAGFAQQTAATQQLFAKATGLVQLRRVGAGHHERLGRGSRRVGDPRVW
jgi:hypothetical protein